MIIDALTALPSTPTTGDELPIERGTTTYKIDYDALATAIINKLGIVLKPSDVVNALTNTATDKPGSAAMLKKLNDDKQDKIVFGFFSVSCQVGQNIITSQTTMLDGTFPPYYLRNVILSITNHGSQMNSPNTVESDGADTIIINAKTAQNIGVSWWYIQQ